MPIKRTLISAALVFALGAVGYWTVQQIIGDESPLCEVCERMIHRGQEYTLILADGSERHTCCPRCGMHFYAAHQDRIKKSLATDYVTGQRIEAELAVYIEGSDIMNCCSTPPLQRGQQTTYEMVWDRCIPSLLAFRGADQARKFQEQHGGRQMRYIEAVQSVQMR